MSGGWSPIGGTTVPSACAHGMAWSLPCAACGRGYPATVANYDFTIGTKLDRIIALLEELRAALGEQP